MKLATALEYPALEGRTQVQALRQAGQAASTGGFPVEVAHLLEVLARIELRRQARLRGMMQEGKD